MSPSTPIRLVALDLDGTLLRFPDAISPPAPGRPLPMPSGAGSSCCPAPGGPLPACRRWWRSCPASGTPSPPTVPLSWDMGTDRLGAVYSRYADAAQRPTHEPDSAGASLFAPGTAREVFALYREYHGPLSIFSDGRSYLDGAGMALFQDRHIQRHSTEARQPDDGRTHVVRDLDEWMSRHAHEVEKFCMFFDTAEQAQAALPASVPLPGPRSCRVRRTTSSCTAQGVDKGTALLALADLLHIPRESTVAVGDSENDRAMLEKAGIAAVMANGMPHIQALADLVSTNDCDHDGVAELFERLGL